MRCVDLSTLACSLIQRSFQIFSCAHPGDLMQISWTSKNLSRFLTSRSSRHVWQAAFGTIPKTEKPPPFPSEITEIAYAKLLYSQLCMVCISFFNQLAGASDQRLQICAKVRPLTRAWTVFLKACDPCIRQMHNPRSPSTPFERSMILSRTSTLTIPLDGWSDPVRSMSRVLPTYGPGARVFP